MIAVAIAAAVMGGVRRHLQDREAAEWAQLTRQSLKTIGPIPPPDAALYRTRAEYNAAAVKNLGRMLAEAERNPAYAAEIAPAGWTPDHLRAWIAWHDDARRRNERAATHPALYIEPDPPMPGYDR